MFYLINVDTSPDKDHEGIARRLMENLVDPSKDEGIFSALSLIVVHEYSPCKFPM